MLSSENELFVWIHYEDILTTFWCKEYMVELKYNAKTWKKQWNILQDWMPLLKQSVYQMNPKFCNYNTQMFSSENELVVWIHYKDILMTFWCK